MRRVVTAVALGCAALALLCGCENKLSVLKRAARLADKGRYTEAVQAYERYIELAGESPAGHGGRYERAEAFYQIGRLYTYHLRDPEKGREAFEQAVALRPDYADPQFHLGIMHFQKARAYLEYRVKRFRALDGARKAQIEPPRPDLAAAAFQRAEPALRQALESRPEMAEYELVPGEVHPPRVILADLERRNGRLNEAIRQLYIHEHYSERNAADWHALGQLFASENEQAKVLFYYKRAFETLDDAERGMPLYMPLRIDLIGAYLYNGYVAEAEELLDESFDILGQVEALYWKLSSWHRHEATELRDVIVTSRSQLLRQRERVSAATGQYDQALDALQEFRTLGPQDPQLLLEEAGLLAMKGAFKRAREVLGRYAQLAPNEPERILTEATILYGEGNYTACLERIEDYISARPHEVRPRALRVLALVGVGHTEEGLAQMEAYCRAEPNFPQLQLTMAQALAIAGRTEEAMWWIGRVMETDIVPPHLLQTNNDLAALRDDPAFPELLRRVRYRINLRQLVHEAEDLVYRGETARGLGALARIRQQNRDIAFTTYALARGHVFVGNYDEAFQLLVECAKAGTFSPATLKQDVYLSELRDDPRFQQVLDAIEQPWPTPDSGEPGETTE